MPKEKINIQNIDKIFDQWTGSSGEKPPEKLTGTALIFSLPIGIKLHKKIIFPLRSYVVNVTKSVGNCGFDQIYWGNP